MGLLTIYLLYFEYTVSCIMEYALCRILHLTEQFPKSFFYLFFSFLSFLMQNLNCQSSSLRYTDLRWQSVWQFIFDGAVMYCVDIATHRHGCCVLQKCIREFTGEHQEKLVAVVAANGFKLAQDPYGYPFLLVSASAFRFSFMPSFISPWPMESSRQIYLAPCISETM